MEKFRKLYRLPNHRIRENTNMDWFVFCGNGWDYYFTRKNRDSEMELLENVVLITDFQQEKYIDSDFDTSWRFLQYA